MQEYSHPEPKAPDISEAIRSDIQWMIHNPNKNVLSDSDDEPHQ
jgi:hypothetical protein